jgi:hypothetical protein
MREIMEGVFALSAVRTPIGGYGGGQGIATIFERV